MCGLVDGIDIWVDTVYALDWMVARIFVLFMGVGVVVGAFRVENTSKTGEILRDGIASGRGVHRFWGVLIQKSRSLLGLKSLKLRKIGKSGVGVV